MDAMEQPVLPEWEQELIDEAIASAERRARDEDERARKRAVQLAREQAYHRLAVAIDRPIRHRITRGQLTLFSNDTPTLFDPED